MMQIGGEEAEPLTWRAYAGVGLLWWLSTEVLSWGGIAAEWPYRAIAAAVFLALGGACWWNARACGAVHCRISAPGYVLVGLVAAASALGVVDVSVGALTVAFLAVALVSLGIEAVLGRRAEDVQG